MKQKVIAIISQDEKLKELTAKFDLIAKDGNVTLEMHKKMFDNTRKQIQENLDSVEKEVAEYLKSKKVLDGEFSEQRHIIIESDEDAIKLCTHDGSQPDYSFFEFPPA